MSCHIVFLSESDRGNHLAGYAPSGSLLADALRQQQGQDEDDQVGHLIGSFLTDGAPLRETPVGLWSVRSALCKKAPKAFFGVTRLATEQRTAQISTELQRNPEQLQATLKRTRKQVPNNWQHGRAELLPQPC